ncbi:hypothetical protein JZ751_003180 [Albula glossodonta]|uniref:BRISC and BRCA1-A complex member 2 n=1 Tax=Albula glossodonta TaxID=121402 RepID=A0A8T2NGL6_9TELE|nr:hypothetical protein JZ751_003180 [Albula glossodonta]
MVAAPLLNLSALLFSHAVTAHPSPYRHPLPESPQLNPATISGRGGGSYRCVTYRLRERQGGNKDGKGREVQRQVTGSQPTHHYDLIVIQCPWKPQPTSCGWGVVCVIPLSYAPSPQPNHPLLIGHLTVRAIIMEDRRPTVQPSHRISDTLNEFIYICCSLPLNTTTTPPPPIIIVTGVTVQMAILSISLPLPQRRSRNILSLPQLCQLRISTTVNGYSSLTAEGEYLIKRREGTTAEIGGGDGYSGSCITATSVGIETCILQRLSKHGRSSSSSSRSGIVAAAVVVFGGGPGGTGVVAVVFVGEMVVYEVMRETELGQWLLPQPPLPVCGGSRQVLHALQPPPSPSGSGWEQGWMFLFRVPGTEGGGVVPVAPLFPLPCHALGGSSALHIPAFPSGGCLIDYVPQVCQLLTNKEPAASSPNVTPGAPELTAL